jgi:ADP-ribose pyrophosphatase YjhB (NUDIX family)
MTYWRDLRKLVGNRQLILSGVAGALVKNNRILLVKHKLINKWQVPGGFQELNESIEDALKREIKEELNINIRVDSLISIVSDPKWVLKYPNGHKVQQLIFFFRIKGDLDEKKITLQKNEVTDYGFFPLRKLPCDTMACCKEKVRHLLNYKGKVILD